MKPRVLWQNLDVQFKTYAVSSPDILSWSLEYAKQTKALWTKKEKSSMQNLITNRKQGSEFVGITRAIADINHHTKG